MRWALGSDERGEWMMERGREGRFTFFWLGILGDLRSEVNMHAYTGLHDLAVKRGFEKCSVIFWFNSSLKLEPRSVHKRILPT